MQVGDTVRYLNAVGGGKVVRIEGKIAYIDDEGFETPVQIRELVVVLPAGHESSTPGKKYFDQEAYDTGRADVRPNSAAAAPQAEATMPEEEEFPIEETEYGDAMRLSLAFEPADVKHLDKTEITGLLVNDSNYFLTYLLLRRDTDSSEWHTEAHGEAAPNELVEFGRYTQESVKKLERIVVQAIASKRDKAFDIKSPISVSRKLDMTKFYKMHCFRPGVYFDTPVLEVPLYADRTPENTKPAKKQNR